MASAIISKWTSDLAKKNGNNPPPSNPKREKEMYEPSLHDDDREQWEMAELARNAFDESVENRNHWNCDDYDDYDDYDDCDTGPAHYTGHAVN